MGDPDLAGLGLTKFEFWKSHGKTPTELWKVPKAGHFLVAWGKFRPLSTFCIMNKPQQYILVPGFGNGSPGWGLQLISALH